MDPDIERLLKSLKSTKLPSWEEYSETSGMPFTSELSIRPEGTTIIEKVIAERFHISTITNNGLYGIEDTARYPLMSWDYAETNHQIILQPGEKPTEGQWSLWNHNKLLKHGTFRILSDETNKEFVSLNAAEREYMALMSELSSYLAEEMRNE